MTLDPEKLYWETAERVCTDKELIALKLHHTRGLGTRRIAAALNVDRRVIRDRLDNANRKIITALEENAA